MNFTEIANARQSCRKYDANRPVEQEKLDSILQVAQLAPSACNGQPYHITICRNKAATEAAKACMGMGMNKFAEQAPVILILEERPYVKSAAVGAKLKKNDYRSMDIGILAAYITAEAAAQGLGSCILGWFDNEKLQKICGTEENCRLAISLGYAADEPQRAKKRKPLDELVSYMD